MVTANIINTIFTAFWIIFGMVVLIILWFFGMVISKFKYRVRVREVVNGRKIIFDDRARFIKRDGQEYLKLMKLKDVLPIPPADVIDIDTKGRRILELYKSEKGEHTWIRDNVQIQEFQPITTEERDFLINNIQRAEQRRGKKWTEHIPAIAGLAALVVIVVCLFIFWSDMGKPLLEMGDKLNYNQEIQLQIVETLERIDNDIQLLKSEDEYKSNTGLSSPPR